ncbi:unnamed protein product [marine sediment metagenome]|uniref:Uncharacterized protein n=1 Tax=marine sediment metagenome TaxID=412755 RepID=X0SST4_9ZZZZ
MPKETAAQRDGRRYEARVGRWLALRAAALGLTVWDHTWLEYQFCHESRTRRAQPDFVLEAEDGGFGYVFEVKQTWVDTTTQLELYTTLLHALGLDVIPATLCHNLTPDTPRDLIVRSFDDIEAGSVMLVRK